MKCTQEIVLVEGEEADNINDDSSLMLSASIVEAVLKHTIFVWPRSGYDHLLIIFQKTNKQTNKSNKKCGWLVDE